LGNTNNRPIRIVDGFCFQTEQDAEMADLERKKIAYLEAKMDYSNPDSILRIYEKAIQDKIFKTPVGFFYLKHLQEYLLDQKEIAREAVEPIPMQQSFGKDATKEKVVKTDKKTSALSFSIILNFLLGAAIVAMFAITLNASQPNILNYEKVITDRYATWEQELTEREQIVREKELELKLETE